jgi:hypothetical protein
VTAPSEPGPPQPAVVHLTLRGHGPFVPTGHVNGRLVTVRWGAQDLVPPGAVVPMFYAPPWSRFMRGSMGGEPQRMPGRWVVAPAALVLLAVPLLVALSFIVR